MNLEPEIRTRNPVRSKSAILKAAKHLFATQGFQKTSLRQIAAKSGANGALVSYYFGGKEGLREAVFEDQVHKLREEADVILSSGTIPTAIPELLALFRRHEKFHRLAFRSLLENASGQSSLLALFWNPLQAALAKKIRAQNKSLSEKSARQRALVLAGLLQHYLVLALFLKASKEDLAAYEAYVVGSLGKVLCSD